MGDFELKLSGGVTYKATSNLSSIDKGKESRSWNVSADFNHFRFNISVPQEKNVTQAQIMVFITAFNEAFFKVRKEQGEELRFLNN